MISFLAMLCAPLSSPTPKLFVPGGGIYYYHLSGQLKYLNESYPGLVEKVDITGSSAGALAATLAASGVDCTKAADLAVEMAVEKDLWSNPLGLAFVWGDIIREWLDVLLPQDSTPENLTVLLTGLGGRARMTNFESKSDLIDCNMGSVHIPWFLDGKMTAQCRGRRFVDGSLWENEEDRGGATRLDYVTDERLQRSKGDFVKLITPDGVYELMDMGYSHAKKRDLTSKDFRHFAQTHEKSVSSKGH